MKGGGKRGMRGIRRGKGEENMIKGGRVERERREGEVRLEKDGEKKIRKR